MFTIKRTAPLGSTCQKWYNRALTAIGARSKRLYQMDNVNEGQDSQTTDTPAGSKVGDLPCLCQC